ncbi:MAG TPA: FAD-dependent oxidoreductase [Candidatus Limnocylindrales bacterium]|nr:FAD-dependent oxidoreductase [Candidatus Limnocylindrales bacterium]
MTSYDVIIAGAGIIGVSLALELREQGAEVLLLERAEPGREASSAAAGMLAPSDPETPAPLRPLAMESARMFPQFVRKLEGRSGIAVDFRRHGAIVLGEHSPPPDYRKLSEQELSELEPGLVAHGHDAFLVAEDSVDPVLLMRAAVRAAEQSGVSLKAGMEVREMRSIGTQVEVLAGSECFLGAAAVNCRGAWFGEPVRPRKGQMFYLQPKQSGAVQHVLRAPGAYIVPRSLGKVLVGTTVEDAGFDKTVEPATISRLHVSAARYIPALSTATVTESWAGLRPGTPDDLPLMGESEKKGVFVAGGHYRNGILLAPATAKIMSGLVLGRPATMDISAFSPSRFAAARA